MCTYVYAYICAEVCAYACAGCTCVRDCACACMSVREHLHGCAFVDARVCALAGARVRGGTHACGRACMCA